jgi:hypothetical protein
VSALLSTGSEYRCHLAAGELTVLCELCLCTDVWVHYWNHAVAIAFLLLLFATKQRKVGILQACVSSQALFLADVCDCLM